MCGGSSVGVKRANPFCPRPRLGARKANVHRPRGAGWLVLATYNFTVFGHKLSPGHAFFRVSGCHFKQVPEL